MELHIYAAKQHFKLFFCIAAIFSESSSAAFPGLTSRPNGNGGPSRPAIRHRQQGGGIWRWNPKFFDGSRRHPCLHRKTRSRCPAMPRSSALRSGWKPRSPLPVRPASKNPGARSFRCRQDSPFAFASKPPDGRVSEPRRAYRDCRTLVQCRKCEKFAALPNSFAKILELILQRSVKLLSMRRIAISSLR